jgi:hypothetical protein
MLAALAACYGLFARWEVVATGFAQAGERNIFFRQYALHEPAFLGLLGLFAVASAVFFASRREPATAEGGSDGIAAPKGRALLLVALIVGGVGFAATHLLFHRLLFSMDEFGLDFQARLFAGGDVATVVPWPWRSLLRVITPIFVGVDETTGQWIAQYLPVYALLKAPFLALGVPSLLNPLLTALAVVELALVARQLWPDEGLRPWVAVALLATSSEVLVTAGTGYSMPAHLLLNIVWLRLYQQGDRKAWAAALVVGALALGLHNPFPHALFVAPFLIRLARERRWTRVAAAVLTYGASGLVWLLWLRSVYVNRGAAGGTTTLFALPGAYAAWLHGMNWTVLLTWHAPIFAILLFVALSEFRRWDPLLTDLGLGVLFTLGFFLFFASTQGHGWGYRYAFQVLGNLCLLAAAAVPTIERSIGRAATRRWLAAGLVVTVLGQLPARLVQTERFVRPFAAGHEYLHTRNARVVLFSGERIWYGRDLLRNDPYLRTPILVKTRELAPGAAEAIERAYPGRVVRVTDEELLRLGMTPRDPHRIFMTPP